MKKTIQIAVSMFLLCAMAACQKAAGIQVTDAWGRASPNVTSTGAFYMTLQNQTNEVDRLTGVQTTACGTVELHETYMTEDGAMGMRPVAGGVIEIPANGEVNLEPGGLHVMCLDKIEDFTAGKKITLTLKFEKAGEVQVTAEIKEVQGMSD